MTIKFKNLLTTPANTTTSPPYPSSYSARNPLKLHQPSQLKNGISHQMSPIPISQYSSPIFTGNHNNHLKPVQFTPEFPIFPVENS